VLGVHGKPAVIPATRFMKPPQRRQVKKKIARPEREMATEQLPANLPEIFLDHHCAERVKRAKWLGRLGAFSSA
jgi:hypothetical protein